jgi:hypothetical protein
MGAGAVGVAVLVLGVGAKHLRGEAMPRAHSRAEAELMATGDVT